MQLLVFLPEDESEATCLAFDATDVHSLHGMHTELPQLDRTGQERVRIHTHIEFLGSRTCTAGNLENKQWLSGK